MEVDRIWGAEIDFLPMQKCLKDTVVHQNWDNS